MNKKVIGIAAVGIVIVGAAMLVVFNQARVSSPNTQSPSSNATSTITYSDAGFEPSTLTVNAGTVITIKNNASGSLQFSSNPHPVHTDNPELNASAISPGGSTHITVTTKGTWGAHNHFDPSHKATIIVK